MRCPGKNQCGLSIIRPIKSISKSVLINKVLISSNKKSPKKIQKIFDRKC